MDEYDESAIAVAVVVFVAIVGLFVALLILDAHRESEPVCTSEVVQSTGGEVYNVKTCDGEVTDITMLFEVEDADA